MTALLAYNCTYDYSEMSRRLEKVEAILQALLQFCQRNSSGMEEKARQVRHCCTLNQSTLTLLYWCRIDFGVFVYCFFVLQQMWFPIFDKIHSLQKKYGNSPNQPLTESNSLQVI